ncbi:cupin (plasmid) [Paraburkholderia sp. PGU19]|uniref:cupin domain-containing protein n=1 Tax=Paraburkholderia sp. PGU19 TaxID=2735434 RepID=UPI0015DAEBEE|nr:cupin domain-containing protein [Paraburkholderia sp. PGU19]BCG03026.1 cupin [Paraburkholderia sp. PGU19]
METSSRAKVGRVVRGGDSYMSQQGSVHAPGISRETVGSEVLYLGVVSVPPGGRTKAHIHEHHDTAHYMLSGDEIEFYTGEELEDRQVVRPGDYIFTPAGVPHVAVNRGPTPAVFVIARNEPTAQESVVMRSELDARVP